MKLVQKLLSLFEMPDYDLVTHDILSLKSKIHNHQVLIRALQNKPKNGNAQDLNKRIDYHKNVITSLSGQLKDKQDRLSKFNHSAGASGGAPASGAKMGSGQGGGQASNPSSVNNLGQIPIGPLRWKKRKKT